MVAGSRGSEVERGTCMHACMGVFGMGEEGKDESGMHGGEHTLCLSRKGEGVAGLEPCV